MANFIGQTLLKQFRVDAFIASGGMGAVYRVWDLKRNVPLAMKVLHGELAEDPSVFKRFQREANALKKLAHPHIVPFYGLYHTLDFAFMLERFIDGPSLKEIIKQKKKQPFSINEAVTYIKALSAALGYAHANGVVHCDVKPGNVMIDQGGNIYLTDFGVARHADSSTTTLGGAGTPAYMPPEQIVGDTVTAASDIYSLGVMLFEMLTGQRPFHGKEEGTEKSGSTMHERIRYAHLHAPAPDPRTINSSMSEPLSAVLLKSLNKNPSERYASTSEFFTAICESAGLDFEEVSDRVVASNLQFEFSTNSIPVEVPEIFNFQIPSIFHKIRRFHPWQLIGAVTLVSFFCILIGRQVFPASAPVTTPIYPIETSLLQPTLDPIVTISPTPVVDPIPISASNINLVKEIYSWSSGDEIISVAFSPNGEYIASGDTAGNIKIWHLWTEEIMFEIPGRYATFSPDGKWLGVAGKTGIYLYDAGSGDLIRAFDDKNPYFSVLFSPDSQLIAGGTTYGVFFIWRINDGNMQKRGGELGGNVHSLSFSQNGILLAAASNTRTYIWNVQLDEMERSLGTSKSRPDYFSAALDDDGEWYATGHNNGKIYMWRVSNSEQIAIFNDDSRFINGLQFLHGSNAPEVLVSGGEFNLSIWTMRGYEIQGRSVRVSTPILTLSIAPDNNLMATGDKDGVIHLWGVLP